MLQPLGQKLWVMARWQDKPTGFQRLSLPSSPTAAATHILLVCCSVISCSQVKFLPDWNWCQVLPSLSWRRQASGNPVSLLQCSMNQMPHLWLPGVPDTPGASGNALSAGQLVMPQCHTAHMSPCTMGQSQCSITVSTAKTPATLTLAGSQPAQGLTYIHAIRKQEYDHHGQWERM